MLGLISCSEESQGEGDVRQEPRTSIQESLRFGDSIEHSEKNVPRQNFQEWWHEDRHWMQVSACTLHRILH
jgi:hypothetical protein